MTIQQPTIMNRKKNKPSRGATIVCAITLSNIPFKTGQANGSGIGKYVYFIPSNQIIAWPTIADNLEDAPNEECYTGYDGDFEIHPDAKWIRVYNTQGEGVVTSDPLGEVDSRLFTNKLSYRFPKLTNEALVLSNAVVNGDGVFIAWHDGAYRVIGHKQYCCTVNPNANTGNTAGSSKGITFEASSPDYKAMPIYRGRILLEDGVLDCESDTFFNYSDMSTNLPKTYEVEGGNTARFSALSQQGRMQLEGTGDIVVEVSVDGENYAAVEHSVAFENGMAIVPCSFVIGDYVRVSATTLTVVKVNWNNVNLAERS